MKTASVVPSPRALAIGVVTVVFGSVLSVIPASSAVAATGDPITGVIWNDYDADGVRGSFEEGLPGVSVQAVAEDASTGTAIRTEVATTAADGSYSLTQTSAAAKWRVEAWFAPNDPRKGSFWPSMVGSGSSGAVNGTTVQFVDLGAGDGSGTDFSFQVPAAMSEQNPNVYVPTLRIGAYDDSVSTRPVQGFNGNANNVGSTTILWDATSPNGELVPQTVQATWSQLGSTNGSAAVPSQQPGGVPTILTSAYMRRHAGFGPLGIGGIYSVAAADGSWSGSGVEPATVGQYLDLTQFVSLGGPQQSTNPYGNGDPVHERPKSYADNPAYDWVRDGEAYDYVGRAGLGLISMDATGQYLFAVNLYNRSLVRIDTRNDLSLMPGADQVDEFFFPATFPDDAEVNGVKPFPSANDLRPYGVSVDPVTGVMYLTATKTGEAQQDPNNIDAGRDQLTGYVYSFDPADLAGLTDGAAADSALTKALEFPLNYNRGPSYAMQYRAWQSSPPLGSIEEIQYLPEPIVASVRVLNGELIIGVRDRTGDLFGDETLYYPDPNAQDADLLVTERSKGDLLIAAPNGDGTFTLEDNGSVGGRTTDPADTYTEHDGFTFPPRTELGGPGNDGGGDDNGQYFHTRWFQPAGHEALGSVVVNPSTEANIMSTAVHAANDDYQEGFRRFERATGLNVSPGALVRSTHEGGSGVSFKGNGLGSATLLAEAAPIEIGNYVWFDVDADGVQDASESPVVGATVHLYQVVDGVVGAEPVDTALTDAAGQYYFSSKDDSYPLQAGAEYVVAVDNPADYADPQILQNWVPTLANYGDADAGAVRPDMNDSDGIVDSASRFTRYPFIAVTTGAPGENNHTYDFGFNQDVLRFEKSTVSGFPRPSETDPGSWVVEYDLAVSNSSAFDSSYRSLTDDVTGFGDGVTVTAAEVVSSDPAGLPVNAGWNGGGEHAGVADLNVVTASADAPVPVAAGATHMYRVRVTVSLADADGNVPPAGELSCTPGQVPGDDTTGNVQHGGVDPSCG